MKQNWFQVYARGKQSLRVRGYPFLCPICSTLTLLFSPTWILLENWGCELAVLKAWFSDILLKLLWLPERTLWNKEKAKDKKAQETITHRRERLTIHNYLWSGSKGTQLETQLAVTADFACLSVVHTHQFPEECLVSREKRGWNQIESQIKKPIAAFVVTQSKYEPSTRCYLLPKSWQGQREEALCENREPEKIIAPLNSITSSFFDSFSY